MATKVGIIGAGGMLQYHAGGFRAGGADIVAICDVNEAAAGEAAADLERQGQGLEALELRDAGEALLEPGEALLRVVQQLQHLVARQHHRQHA